MITLHLIGAMVLTCLIETPLINCLLSKYKIKSLTSNTILINCITNLTLNLLVMVFYNMTWLNMFVYISEAIIPVIEWKMFLYCYKQLPTKQLLVISYIVNACSFIFGLIPKFLSLR